MIKNLKWMANSAMHLFLQSWSLKVKSTTVSFCLKMKVFYCNAISIVLILMERFDLIYAENAAITKTLENGNATTDAHHSSNNDTSQEMENNFFIKRVQARSAALTANINSGLNDADMDSSKTETVGNHVPFCAEVSATTAEVHSLNLDKADLLVHTVIQSQLYPGQTVCLRITVPMEREELGNHAKDDRTDLASTTNSSGAARYLLYTLKYESLEQEYPVRQRYEFALPRIESSCVCDCPGGEDICSVIHRYRNCSRGANNPIWGSDEPICVTTYHAHQSAKGCVNGGPQSDLCCDVRLRPNGAMRFHALNLAQSTATLRLQMRKYVMRNESQITNEKDLALVYQNTFQIPLDRAQSVLTRDDMKLSVQTEGNQLRLQDGMNYFAPISPGNIGESSIYTGLPLNEFQEWNLGKLGWFRKDNNGATWTLKNANMKLQLAQQVQVHDCMAQTYSDLYDAEFYNMEPDSILNEYASKLQHYYYGIQSAKYYTQSAIGGASDQRVVKLVLSNGPSIRLNAVLKDRQQIDFSFQESILSDFDGSIRLDRLSNRFLNVTFFGARGSLLGSVYSNASLQVVDAALSAFIDSSVPIEQTQFLALSASVNSSRWVCFATLTKSDEQKCKLLPYFEEPLSWFTMPDDPWSNRKGHCPGCNRFSKEDFFRYLNPVEWFKGIKGPSELIAVCTELMAYVIILAVAFACCRKCVCPLLRWSICNRRPANTGKKNWIEMA